MIVPAVVLLLALGASWWMTRRRFRAVPVRVVPTATKHRKFVAAATVQGGAIIAVVVLSGIVIGAVGGWVRGTVALALIPSGAAVAILQWRHDNGGVSPAARVATHLAAAAWIVYCFGAVEVFGLERSSLLGAVAAVVSVLGIAGIANLWTLMDRIDGLTGGAALSVGIAAMVLCIRTEDPEPAWIAGLLAAAAGGFLPWSWPPARLLMGSAGAAFAGFLFASLGVLVHQRGDVPVQGWLVLLGVFVADLVLTLLKRALFRKPVLTDAQDFAYQRANRGGLSPAWVTGIAMGLNLVLGGLVFWSVVEPKTAGKPYAVAGIILVVAYLLAGWTPRRPAERPRVL